MIEKIAAAYKFNKLPNSDYLIEECEVHLAQVITKFQPMKDGKQQNAFGYFSVIIMRWWFHEKEKIKKNWERRVFFAEVPKELEATRLSVKHPYVPDRIKREYLSSVLDEVKRWQELPSVRDQERNLLFAIEKVFSDIDQLQELGKRDVFQRLRELTGMDSKQVSNNISKIRKKYRKHKQRWLNADD
jgi:hypothetical protein